MRHPVCIYCEDGLRIEYALSVRPDLILYMRSNPMAGVDATLLALSGTGYADGRSFGFASCERAVGAAEVRLWSREDLHACSPS